MPNFDSVSDPAGAERMVKQAVENFGKIDGVINNAGILRDRIFHRMSHVDWKMVIDVHLNGAFNVSRAAANYFKEQKSGAFVHFTSTSGLVGNFGQANYSAAKMGIVGLSRSIALDMAAFNVRSNCISPFAWTRMIGTIPADTDAQKARLERSKKMTPAKIAPMAVFLLSDAAEGVTSQIFGVRMNEIMLFNANRPVRSVHNLRGLDPGGDRRDGGAVDEAPTSPTSSARPSTSPGIRSDLGPPAFRRLIRQPAGRRRSQDEEARRNGRAAEERTEDRCRRGPRRHRRVGDDREPEPRREGGQRVVDKVEGQFRDLGLKLERTPGRDGFGDILECKTPRNGARGEGKGILVLAHLDTVHPIGMIEKDLKVRREGDSIFGPGIYDMKAGGYIAYYALRHLIRQGKKTKLPVTFLFIPEEEVGSPTSRARIEEAAQGPQIRAGDGAGPRRRQGRDLAQGRRPLHAHGEGRGGHAGVRHQDGRSAILEMATPDRAHRGQDRLCPRHHLQCRPDQAAARGVNVVPAECTAEVDLRVPDHAARRGDDALVPRPRADRPGGRAHGRGRHEPAALPEGRRHPDRCSTRRRRSIARSARS